MLCKHVLVCMLQCDGGWGEREPSVRSSVAVHAPRGALERFALRLAKEDKKFNNVTARMLKTTNKHKQTMKEKKRELRQLHAKMAPHDKAVDERIKAYTIKATDAHNKRHKKTLHAIQDTIKMIGKSRAQIYASNLRIASKYGYVRPPRRSSHRISRSPVA